MIRLKFGYWQFILFSMLPIMFLSSCTNRLVLDGLTGSAPADRIDVWFVKPAGDEVTLARVSRSRGTGDDLKRAVEELLRGPSPDEIKSGIGSEIPRGTILLGLDLHGDNIELNLSRRFASGGGSSSMEMRLEQLSRTVAAAAGEKKVFLSVEGQRLSTAAGEGLEIKQPIN